MHIQLPEEPAPRRIFSLDDEPTTHHCAADLRPKPKSQSQAPPLEWDWDEDRADRAREAQADAEHHHHHHPFEVDRRVLRDVVRDKMGAVVVRIRFISAGTFHKAYLVLLADGRELVARVARRFMPRLKTESEVATLGYLRAHTSVPVPTVYHYDSSPYNRLGGEYILMSKAPGVPLSTVYHALPHDTLAALLAHLAALLIPLFGHRFSHIGSLYSGPAPGADPAGASAADTPTPATPLVYPLTPQTERSHADFLPLHATAPHSYFRAQPPRAAPGFHVGPIVSWPFFGSGRGELTHPAELDRGPWASARAYRAACVRREVDGVRRENDGRAKPHRLHLDPDDVVPRADAAAAAAAADGQDGADDEGSEGAEESGGSDSEEDAMYRDYRRFQRSTFLVAHLVAREEQVGAEMERFVRCMDALEQALAEQLRADADGGAGAAAERHGVGGAGAGADVPEEFALDCHDLSLENVFVDEHDHTRITCIIDWESTTTRPLWAAAHLPSFLLASPHAAHVFRRAVRALPAHAFPHARAWAALEGAPAAAALRYAHKCVEWDGWEEGLVPSILGPLPPAGAGGDEPLLAALPASGGGSAAGVLAGAGAGPAVSAEERERLKTLDGNGDVCGGRGGELGLRLEAWLSEGARRACED